MEDNSLTPILKIAPAHAFRPYVRPQGEGVVFSAVFHDSGQHGLQLIHIPDGETVYIPFTDEYRVGRVYSAYITPFDSGEWLYRYKSGDMFVPDPHAFGLCKVTIRTGNAPAEETAVTACSCHPLRAEDLYTDPAKKTEKNHSVSVDQSPEKPLPPADWNSQVIYGLHVKGLTAAKAEDFPGRGTFAGIARMIPYLQDLGITAVELMPVYTPLPNLNKKKTFRTMQEALGAWPVSPKGDPMRDMKERPNYWGYGRGMYYSLREQYGSQRDFAQMVRAFHNSGMRVLLQINFEKGISVSEQIGLLRFYINRYGVDGFRLMGHIPSPSAIAAAPSLADTALFFPSFPFEEMEEEAEAARVLYEEDIENLLPSVNDPKEDINGPAGFMSSPRGRSPRTAPAAKTFDFSGLVTCDDQFQTLLRRFVKSDDYVMKDFLKAFLSVPAGRSELRYVTSYAGFTLADLVSYNERHNEANGEFGLDGAAENYSWNCGEEGETDNEEVLSLRRRQVRNFLTLMLLSRGTPLLRMGDERGNSQQGNNNPYCQDNEISWIDWTDTPERTALTRFTRQLISFRREHPVFTGKKPFQYIDYLGIGHPDVSLHGEEAWMPDLGSCSHSIGISYCENYAGENVPAHRNSKGKKQLSFTYIAVNMYWNELLLALPKLPPHYVWKVIMDTESEKGFLDRPIRPDDLHRVSVAPRSIRILRSFPDLDSMKEERDRERMQSMPPVGAVIRDLRRAKAEKIKRYSSNHGKGSRQKLKLIRSMIPPRLR